MMFFIDINKFDDGLIKSETDTRKLFNVITKKYENDINKGLSGSYLILVMKNQKKKKKKILKLLL